MREVVIPRRRARQETGLDAGPRPAILRRLVHVPASLVRTGAQFAQRVPGAPVTPDQIAMIEAGDNTATTTDAVDTFQLPLVSLEEQIRRAA